MKILKELTALSWTLAGTGLVLITLAGRTRFWGIVISLVGLGLHFLGVALTDKGNDNEE